MDNLEQGVQESVEQLNTEGSSEPSSSQTTAETQSGQVEQEAKPTETTPFHEHPRFKELIEQKNQQAEQIKAYQQQMQELKAQFTAMQPKQKSPEEALLERLKGIDPEFGGWAENIDQARRELAEFKQWKEQLEMEQGRQQVQSSLENLYKENKVSDNMKELYQSQIESIAYNNPNLKPSDLPKVFKQVHENLSKWAESYERNIRSKYVTEVKKETAPASQTGGAPAGIPASSGINSREELKNRIVDEIRRAKQKI